jgi:putative oxidoreductase
VNGNTQLKIAASLSFIAASLHVAIIFGGPEWYRFFGAGEGMAKLAESGSTEPTVIAFSIAVVLTVWGLYALSGAGVIPKLPLLKLALCLISAVFLLRGVAGFILPIFTNHPAIAQNSATFWLVSSAICCVFGVFYVLGTKNNWERML